MSKFKFSSITITILALTATSLVASANGSKYLKEGEELQPSNYIENYETNEVSGIIKSKRYPNTYWIHNDSGDSARIFAITKKGEIIMPKWYRKELKKELLKKDGVEAGDHVESYYKGITLHNASNIDWEDIACDDNFLYISDMGNNGNWRRDQGVYIVAEPNPEQAPWARPLTWIPVRYEDQAEFPPQQGDWAYDCEGLFNFGNKLYFVTKERENYKIGTPLNSASIYRLDTRFKDHINVLKKVSRIENLGGWPTGADINDKGELALIVNRPVQSIWLFKKPQDSDDWFSGEAYRYVFHGAKQAEAICFDEKGNFLVTNEDGDLFEIPRSKLKKVQPEG